jgi:hypothetical protein
VGAAVAVAVEIPVNEALTHEVTEALTLEVAEALAVPVPVDVPVSFSVSVPVPELRALWVRQPGRVTWPERSDQRQLHGF